MQFIILHRFIMRKTKIGSRSCRSKTLSDEVENEGEQNENQSKPLGQLCELLVKGLALTHEGFCTAGDNAETGTLTALEKNDDSNSKTGNNLKNSDDGSENRHLFQSFRLYTAMTALQV